MPDLRPPELAALVDVAERPRAGNWSLRAAMTRYAQGQPQRVSDLLALVRRIDAALGAERTLLEQEGPALWQALLDGSDDGLVLGLLRALQEIDRVADALAVWADDISGERPEALVDEAIASVRERLEVLGVPKEEPPPRGARRRG